MIFGLLSKWAFIGWFWAWTIRPTIPYQRWWYSILWLRSVCLDLWWIWCRCSPSIVRRINKWRCIASVWIRWPSRRWSNFIKIIFGLLLWIDNLQSWWIWFIIRFLYMDSYIFNCMICMYYLKKYIEIFSLFYLAGFINRSVISLLTSDVVRLNTIFTRNIKIIHSLYIIALLLWKKYKVNK